MLRRAILCVGSLAVGLASAAPALASGGGAEGAEKLNPLSFESWQTDLALWTAVVFVVLFIVLKRFAWGPLADGLDKREKHIADQIAHAEDANRQAKDLLANYEKKLAAARDEVRDILEQGRRDAEQVGREMLDKAKAEAKGEQQRAMQQISAATAAAVQELADQSAAMAVTLAGKIVHAELKRSDHDKLIQQAVAGFVQGPGGADHASRN